MHDLVIGLFINRYEFGRAIWGDQHLWNIFNLSCGVIAHEVKDFFGQIDRNGAKLLLHGTHPPNGYMKISVTELIVAYQSQSAQERVHIIRTRTSFGC